MADRIAPHLTIAMAPFTCRRQRAARRIENRTFMPPNALIRRSHRDARVQARELPFVLRWVA
jgi:hypothetical protein